MRPESEVISKIMTYGITLEELEEACLVNWLMRAETLYSKLEAASQPQGGILVKTYQETVWIQRVLPLLKPKLKDFSGGKQTGIAFDLEGKIKEEDGLVFLPSKIGISRLGFEVEYPRGYQAPFLVKTRDPFRSRLEYRKENETIQLQKAAFNLDRLSGTFGKTGDDDLAIIDLTTNQAAYRFNGTGGKRLAMELGKWFTVDREMTYSQRPIQSENALERKIQARLTWYEDKLFHTSFSLRYGPDRSIDETKIIECRLTAPEPQPVRWPIERPTPPDFEYVLLTNQDLLATFDGWFEENILPLRPSLTLEE